MPEDQADICADLTADIFGVREISDHAAEQIVSLAEIAPVDGKRGPLDPVRHICRSPQGELLVADISGVGITQIGRTTTFAVAGELATAILAGDTRAETHPGVVRTLALAYAAAMATSERRRHKAQEAYRNKELAA